ncbi:MAG TPA: hypothetical protein VGN63_14880 [Flavisolibacter sp.]|jgi:hypothetical protein|nr:hypothetical protein [Flavisolibacter sp.]
MKQKLFFLSLLITVTLLVNAQEKPSKELHLYASLGVKPLQQKTFFFDQDVSPALATTVGAGSLLQRGKFQYGVEFFYAKGQKHTGDLHADYSGLNSQFLVGYRFQLDESWRLSLQSGFGFSLNHLYVTNESHQSASRFNTVVFHNNNYHLPAAVFLQKLAPNGTFIGLKAGYNIVLKANHWEFREGGNAHQFHSPSESWSVQLNLGGLLNLKP